MKPRLQRATIYARVSTVITDVRCSAGPSALNVGTPNQFTIKFCRSLAGVEVVLGSIDATGGAGMANLTLTLAAPETVANNASYYFKIAADGSVGFLCSSVGYKVA